MNHSKQQASPNITMEKRASIKVACGCFIIFGGESRRNDRPSHETCSQRAVLRIATEGPRKVCFGGWNMAIGKKTCSGKCCDLYFQVFSIYIYPSKFVHLDLLFVWIYICFCAFLNVKNHRFLSPLSLGRQSSPIRFPVVGTQLETWNTSRTARNADVGRCSLISTCPVCRAAVIDMQMGGGWMTATSSQAGRSNSKPRSECW